MGRPQAQSSPQTAERFEACFAATAWASVPRSGQDLDFTLTDPSHLDEAFLRTVFGEIGERVYQESGIALPADYQKFEIYENPRGKTSCQGKIGYQGPISPQGKSMPRIKLDLTADECVVLPAVQSEGQGACREGTAERLG